MKKSLIFQILLITFLFNSNLSFSSTLDESNLEKQHSQNSYGGGGVIGDGTELVTLPDGRKVPADFIAELPNNEIPDHYIKVDLENDYPEVFKSYKELSQIIYSRAFIPRAFFDLRKYFHDFDFEFLHIYKTNKLKCSPQNYPITKKISFKEGAGCAYVFKFVNQVNYKNDSWDVVELKQSIFDDPSIEPHTKAIIVVHEVLHHLLNTKEAINSYEDIHQIIYPFIRNLYAVYELYQIQKQYNSTHKDLYKLSKEQIKLSEKLQFIVNQFLFVSFRNQEGKLLKAFKNQEYPTQIISQGGGAISMPCYGMDLNEVLKNSYVDLASSIRVRNCDFLIQDSAIWGSSLYSKDLILDKVKLIDSSIASAQVHLSNTEISKSMLLNNDSMYSAATMYLQDEEEFYESRKNSFDAPNMGYYWRSSQYYSVITCSNCTISDIDSNDTRILGKDIELINSSFDTGRIEYTNLYNSKAQYFQFKSPEEYLLTIKNCELRSFYLENKNSAKSTLVENFNLHIDIESKNGVEFDLKNVDNNTLSFDKNKSYKITNSELESWPFNKDFNDNISTVKKFEKEFLKFGNEIEYKEETDE